MTLTPKSLFTRMAELLKREANITGSTLQNLDFFDLRSDSLLIFFSPFGDGVHISIELRQRPMAGNISYTAHQASELPQVARAFVQARKAHSLLTGQNADALQALDLLQNILWGIR